MIIRGFNPLNSLFNTPSNSAIAKELEEISKILDPKPNLMDIAYPDLIQSAP